MSILRTIFLTAPAPPHFSWTIFLTLAVCLGAALAMFLLLVRRWTTQRQWVSLAEWARQRDFQFHSTDVADLPAALQPLKVAHLSVRLHLCSQGVTVSQICTDPPAEKIDPNVWNVLIRRRLQSYSNPAALRPTNAPASLVDLFGLSQFPTISATPRFTVFSTSSTTARALAESASRTLMPADIGLILADDWIVLDFSTRPFDPIELDRMIALGEQLSKMV